MILREAKDQIRKTVKFCDKSITAMQQMVVDDGSRVGALRFCDEQGVFQRAAEADGRAAPPLLELRHLLAASRAVETGTETATELAYLQGR